MDQILSEMYLKYTKLGTQSQSCVAGTVQLNWTEEILISASLFQLKLGHSGDEVAGFAGIRWIHWSREAAARGFAGPVRQRRAVPGLDNGRARNLNKW